MSHDTPVEPPAIAESECRTLPDSRSQSNNHGPASASEASGVPSNSAAAACDRRGDDPPAASANRRPSTRAYKCTCMVNCFWRSRKNASIETFVMKLPARDHRRGVLGGGFQAFEAERRRGGQRCSGGGHCASARGFACSGVVEGRGRLRCNQRGTARCLHALDGRFPARDLVRVASPGGGQDRKDPLALRAEYLVPDSGNGFPVNGRGRAALQHAATVRRRVPDADHGSGHMLSRKCGFRVKYKFTTSVRTVGFCLTCSARS